MDRDNIYGFGRSRFANRARNAGANWAAQEPYHIFAASKESAEQIPPKPGAGNPKRRPARGAGAAGVPFTWSKDAPVRARALVLADQTLFFAGAPNLGNSSEEAYAAMKGERGGKIVAVSATDGSRLLTSPPSPLHAVPVLDGMAAAGGKLYVSLTDGSVMCFGGK
jgi:hypothetical protein